MSDYYETGRGLIRSNPEEAIKMFREAMKTEGKEDLCLLSISKCYFILKKYDDCIKEVQKILDKKPLEFNALMIQGTAYQMQFKYIPALKAFTEARNCGVYEPKCMSELYQKICLCYFEIRRYVDSYNAIKNAIYYDCEASNNDKSKKSKTIYLYLIVACNHIENYSECWRTIDEEWIQWYPNEIPLIENRAFALCEQRMFEDCINYCTSNSEKKDWRYYIAKSYFYQHNYKKALLTLFNLLKENKSLDKLTKEKTYYLIGKIYLTHQEDNNALNHLIEAHSWNPKNIDIIVDIAEWYIKSKNNKYALGILNEANNHIDEEHQKETELYYLLIKCEVLFNWKNYSEAKELFLYVKDTIGKELTEISYVKTTFMKVLRKYFELYPFYEGYSLQDLVFNPKESIAKGGFSVVYRGKLKDMEVAIKEYNYKPDIDNNFEFDYSKWVENINHSYKYLLLINQEISTMEILSRQNHPTLKVISLFFRNNCWYLITPFCYGTDWYQVIHNKSIVMSQKRKIEILLQIADALQYMHSFDPPYIHHDIKSLNVLLESPYDDNKYNRVVVSDFGWTLRKPKSQPGFTEFWGAPELYRYSAAYNYTVDIYSFGMVIYELFSGIIPFQGKDKDSIRMSLSIGYVPKLDDFTEEVPKGIQNIMNQCIWNEPAKRPSWDVIIKELKNHL